MKNRKSLFVLALIPFMAACSFSADAYSVDDIKGIINSEINSKKKTSFVKGDNVSVDYSINGNVKSFSHQTGDFAIWKDKYGSGKDSSELWNQYITGEIKYSYSVSNDSGDIDSFSRCLNYKTKETPIEKEIDVGGETQKINIGTSYGKTWTYTETKEFHETDENSIAPLDEIINIERTYSYVEDKDPEGKVTGTVETWLIKESNNTVVQNYTGTLETEKTTNSSTTRFDYKIRTVIDDKGTKTETIINSTESTSAKVENVKYDKHGYIIDSTKVSETSEEIKITTKSDDSSKKSYEKTVDGEVESKVEDTYVFVADEDMLDNAKPESGFRNWMAGEAELAKTETAIKAVYDEFFTLTNDALDSSKEKECLGAGDEILVRVKASGNELDEYTLNRVTGQPVSIIKTLNADFNSFDVVPLTNAIQDFIKFSF